MRPADRPHQGSPYLSCGTPDKSKVRIPVSYESAREHGKILTAQVKEFFEAQLDKLKTATLTAKEVQDVVMAAARLNDLMRSQYAADLLPEGDHNNDPKGTGRALAGVIAAAAKGAASGTADGFMAKLKEMERAAKPKPVTEIKPAEPLDNG